MISPFQDKDTRNALTLNGYTFNQEIGGSTKDIVRVDRVLIQTAIQAIHEPREYSDGLETYGSFKRGKRIVLYGIISAATRGGLYDRIEEFAAAVDPALATRDNPTTFGILPLDFNVPSAGGLKACRYYVKAEQALEPPLTDPQGFSVPFILPLLASDPRRYLQASKSASHVGVGNFTADNSIATFPSWPIVTLTLDKNYTTDQRVWLYNADPASEHDVLILQLQGLNAGDVVTVDMERKEIKVNGVVNMGVYNDREFWQMRPGNTVANVGDAPDNWTGTVEITWRPAFSY